MTLDPGARIDIIAEDKQNGKVRRVGLLAAGQVEGDGMTVEIGFQVDFG